MKPINKTTAIIEFLSSNKEPKKLTEISRALNISNSTAHRILSSLKDTQWLTWENKTKRYAIGNHLLKIAVSIVSELDIKKISLPYIQGLSRKLNESVYLTYRIGLERMFLEQIHGEHELLQFVEMGKSFPLWTGAPGKVIMAHLDAEEIEMVINQFKKANIRYLASGQPIKITMLRKELSEIRKKGIAFSSGERIVGSFSVAAPIFDCNGKILGSVSIGGPNSRFNKKKAIHCSPHVIETANKISLQLGHSITQN